MRVFLTVGLMLVAVGVIGEWRYGERLEEAHNAVHAYDLGKLTEADQKAGDAADNAQRAKDVADSTLKELAEYKAKKADRRLTLAQQMRIASKLSAFLGERGDIWWDSGNFEHAVFAGDIEAALKKAHWKTSNRPEITGYSGNPTGVGVVIFTEPTDRSELIGERLYKALTSEGVSVSLNSFALLTPTITKVLSDRKSLDPYATRVGIFVGSHP